MIDPYAILGVQPTATPTEITHAYRRQLRRCHPDMRSGQSNPGADQRLRQVLAAYRLLRDPQLRNDYDRAAGVKQRQLSTRIPVNRKDSAHGGAPLWAGPVRWQP